MRNRTLVKVSASEYCIGFKTISWTRKSPRTFLITRDEFVKLEHEDRIIVHDIHDFAAYSFFFRTFYNGRPTMCGGLILHNFENDLKKAYYSVHT